jgi:hypothetical protein
MERSVVAELVSVDVMSDSPTLTVWEIDKEVTIAAFAGYLTYGNPFEGEHRAMAEDLFAEIQGREIVLFTDEMIERAAAELANITVGFIAVGHKAIAERVLRAALGGEQ